jgi:transcriptional regulator with XRE-family HTH domain
MTPDQFKSWRKAMGLKQKEAADLLGLKKRVIQYYEHGKRDGKAVEIPKTVALACYAVTVGIESYDGAIEAEPVIEAEPKKPAPRTRKS